MKHCSREFARWSRTFAGWSVLLVCLRTVVAWSYFGFPCEISYNMLHSQLENACFLGETTNKRLHRVITHQEPQLLGKFSRFFKKKHQTRQGATKRVVIEPGRALSVENIFKQNNFPSKKGWQAQKPACEGPMHNEILWGELETYMFDEKTKIIRNFFRFDQDETPNCQAAQFQTAPLTQKCKHCHQRGKIPKSALPMKELCRSFVNLRNDQLDLCSFSRGACFSIHLKALIPPVLF